MNITIRKSKRARRISIRVSLSQGIVVVSPLYIKEHAIKNFLSEHYVWVNNALQKLHRNSIPIVSTVPTGVAWRARAKKELRDRARELAMQLQVNFCGFSLKNTTTRWGSCSSLGNITIHEKVFFLPPELSEYILVHELCHLKHMNHSHAFWCLVEKVLPDYKAREIALRRYHV